MGWAQPSIRLGLVYNGSATKGRSITAKGVTKIAAGLQPFPAPFWPN